jgi:hypothetical protein
MTEENFGRYYHIIEEIKSGLVGFSFTSIVHENRAMNKESNDQARQALSQTLGIMCGLLICLRTFVFPAT